MSMFHHRAPSFLLALAISRIACTQEENMISLYTHEVSHGHSLPLWLSLSPGTLRSCEQLPAPCRACIHKISHCITTFSGHSHTQYGEARRGEGRGGEGRGGEGRGGEGRGGEGRGGEGRGGEGRGGEGRRGELGEERRGNYQWVVSFPDPSSGST